MLLASVAVVIAMVCTNKRRMGKIEDLTWLKLAKTRASLSADHAADLIFLHDSWGYVKMKAKREELRFLKKQEAF